MNKKRKRREIKKEEKFLRGVPSPPFEGPGSLPGSSQFVHFIAPACAKPIARKNRAPLKTRSSRVIPANVPYRITTKFSRKQKKGESFFTDSPSTKLSAAQGRLYTHDSSWKEREIELKTMLASACHVSGLLRRLKEYGAIPTGLSCLLRPGRHGSRR